MKLTYAVVNCAGIWKIVGERRRIGTFLTCAEALDAAKRLGREAESGGCDIALFVQETTGLLTACDIHEPTAEVRAAPALAMVV